MEIIKNHSKNIRFLGDYPIYQTDILKRSAKLVLTCILWYDKYLFEVYLKYFGISTRYTTF